ncbi:MAG: hypothetical protein ABSE73_11985 [Planctomycetota bacterium]
MERGTWSAEAWGNPGTVEKVTADGFALLKLGFTGGPKDKVVFSHPTCFGVAQAGKVRLHLFAPAEEQPFVALVLCAGPAGRWHEGRPAQLQKGWNKLEFAVGAHEWKTEANGWKYTAAVEPCDDIRAVNLAVYNGSRAGAVYAAGLAYDLDSRGERIATLIEDLRSSNRAQREQAEQGLLACGRQVLEPLNQLGDDEPSQVLLRAACVLRDLEQPKEDALGKPEQKEGKQQPPSGKR